jgi:hypothetical protein
MKFMFLIAALAALIAIDGMAHGATDISMGPSSSNLRVTHSPGLRPAALQAISIYPRMLTETQESLGVQLPERTVHLSVLNDEMFRSSSGTNQVMAYAVPSKNLIVMNYDALKADVLVLRATLKHEIAHLVIHAYAGGDMHKWLDEGISQWASGGHSEIRQGGEGWPLSKAALTGRIIPLGSLVSSFPGDEARMRLAYSESLSAVDYMVSEYGANIIGKILRDAASGTDIRVSFYAHTGISLDDFTVAWETRLMRRASIMSFIKAHFYEVLFLLAALALAAGFMRNHYRIRTYRDPEEESPQETEEGE